MTPAQERAMDARIAARREAFKRPETWTQPGGPFATFQAFYDGLAEYQREVEREKRP